MTLYSALIIIIIIINSHFLYNNQMYIWQSSWLNLANLLGYFDVPVANDSIANLLESSGAKYTFKHKTLVPR